MTTHVHTDPLCLVHTGYTPSSTYGLVCWPCADRRAGSLSATPDPGRDTDSPPPVPTENGPVWLELSAAVALGCLLTLLVAAWLLP